jgi:hypothetical protein
MSLADMAANQLQTLKRYLLPALPKPELLGRRKDSELL